MSRTYRKQGDRTHSKTGNRCVDKDIQRLPSRSFRISDTTITRDWDDERGGKSHSKCLRLISMKIIQNQIKE